MVFQLVRHTKIISTAVVGRPPTILVRTLGDPPIAPLAFNLVGSSDILVLGLPATMPRKRGLKNILTLSPSRRLCSLCFSSWRSSVPASSLCLRARTLTILQRILIIIKIIIYLTFFFLFRSRCIYTRHKKIFFFCF